MNMCTTHKAAQMLNVSVSVIQLWIEVGILKAWKTPGGHRRITLASILQLADKNKDLLAMHINDDAVIFNILYVGDNKDLSDFFCRSFAHFGTKLEIFQAANGLDALVSLGHLVPDLLVTDLNMPRMDGFEMIRHIRNNKDFNKTKIVVVSDLPQHQIIEQGGIPEDIAVFLKPAQFEALAELIEWQVIKKLKSRENCVTVY